MGDKGDGSLVPRKENMTREKLSTGPRAGARGLNVNGNTSIPEAPLRPRAYACTWREACKAADYVLEHFGNPLRDRGIWVWYCQRLGLDRFLDLADEVISSARQHEIKWPAADALSPCAPCLQRLANTVRDAQKCHR